MEILNTTQQQRLLDIAYTVSQFGHIQQANRIFDAILMENPTYSAALIGKALTHLMVDKFAESEEALKKILEENPNDEEATAILALNYFLSNESQKAKETAEKIQNTSSSAHTLAQGLLSEIR